MGTGDRDVQEEKVREHSQRVHIEGAAFEVTLSAMNRWFERPG